MPRMSLPAAVLSLFVAAWTVQPALADGGRPAADTSKPAATASKGSSKTPRLLAPFSKLRQLTKKSGSNGTVQQASHKDSQTKARTAAYNDESEAPAATPPRPLPSPAPVAPAPQRVNPAYSPIPGPAGQVGVAVVPGYPNLNAPLNPSPVPYVPHQVGSTIITNQAFYPQEMLYAHKYHAMYPPYYYKVRGHWMVTPFGVWSNDHWELQGTEVKVNYRSHYAPFSHFHVPHTGFGLRNRID